MFVVLWIKPDLKAVKYVRGYSSELDGEAEIKMINMIKDGDVSDSCNVLFVSGCEQMPSSAVVAPPVPLCCCTVCLLFVCCSGLQRSLGWPRAKAPAWVSSGSCLPFIILTTAWNPARSQPGPQWPEPVTLQPGNKPRWSLRLIRGGNSQQDRMVSVNVKVLSSDTQLRHRSWWRAGQFTIC